jgi:hypothetical protein
VGHDAISKQNVMDLNSQQFARLGHCSFQQMRSGSNRADSVPTKWNDPFLSPKNQTKNGHHALKNIRFLTDVLKHGIKIGPAIAPSHRFWF